MVESMVVPPHRLHEFKHSKFRTAEWVSTVSECGFYSPSAPRSEISDDDGHSEASDVESSHSIPPRLMLRYGDGRPDIPIPHVHDISNKDLMSRSQTFPQDPYHQTGSSLHSRTKARGHDAFISSVPEEILIYPSADARNGGSMHTRSKSLPRNAFHNQGLPPRIVSEPLYSPSSIPPPLHDPRAQWRGHSSHHRQPAPVNYPSNHSRPAHYQPPSVYSYPHKIGPNGMIYSHSAPVPNMRYPSAPYPSAMAPPKADHRGRSRSRSRRHPDRRNESLDSRDSERTYYVMQGQQKVHGLRTPDLTFYAPSSSSKSPTTPITPTSASSFHKRPFFHRLFHFAERKLGPARVTSHNEKHLRRRHSSEHIR